MVNDNDEGQRNEPRRTWRNMDFYALFAAVILLGLWFAHTLHSLGLF